MAAGFAIGPALLGGFAPVTPFGWIDLRPEMFQGKGAATCLRGTRKGTAQNGPGMGSEKCLFLHFLLDGFWGLFGGDRCSDSDVTGGTCMRLAERFFGCKGPTMVRRCPCFDWGASGGAKDPHAILIVPLYQ